MPIAAHVVPPTLHDGDRLTALEFIRRWEAMPGLKHAELIDGIVCMPSPVTNKHSDFAHILSGWIFVYSANVPGCRGGSEGTWLMGERDITQPDITFRILPDQGGQLRLEGEYAAGAPELIVEVAISSRSRDLNAKLRLYKRMGVREYLVAIPSKEQFVWNELVGGVYLAREVDSDGVIRSRCFPGLWLDLAALWKLDQSRILAVLQQGLQAAN